ncbi:MAG: hypothetical protein O7I93_03540, partial [Gemmatimonadetes bacterium]|nr:hypothetical protein [Gemmatimonadota bacterium]
MNPTRRALVRLTFPAALVGLYTACDELTVDETTQVDQIQVQVGCRDGDGDFPGLKSCTMSVGEV